MSPSVLVIGGTGPTGPTVIHGLLDRGYDVTILHAGLHELAELPDSVPHVHADPHFPEPLADAVVGRTFDLVVAQYGRLRVIVDVFRGRTGRLIAIGAATGMAAGPTHPGWGRLGRPSLLTENRVVPADDRKQSTTLALRMAQARDHLFDAHADGAFSATYLGYPVLYGPRQPGPQDWSIIRRALDGRRTMITADGGLKLETRGYTVNVAHSVLLAAERPEVAAGKSYIVCDPHTYTMRQRIDFIASVLGHNFEYVDLSWPQARPCHPLWRYERNHRLCDSALIRAELGYTEQTPVDNAVQSAVEWLLAHPPQPGGELEKQIGDSFDYAAEDRLIEVARRASSDLTEVDYALPGYAHQYRHPKTPGEPWAPATTASGGSTAGEVPT